MSTIETCDSTLASDGRKIFMLALLLEAGPLDVGEALLLSISCSFRLHDGLGVRGRGRGGGAAHGGCVSPLELPHDGVAARRAELWLTVAPAPRAARER